MGITWVITGAQMVLLSCHNTDRLNIKEVVACIAQGHNMVTVEAGFKFSTSCSEVKLWFGLAIWLDVIVNNFSVM